MRVFDIDLHQNMPSISTVGKWVKFHPWLKYEGTEQANRIWCDLCLRHEDRIKYLRNFNRSMIEGATGEQIKKDQVDKHAKSLMHLKALDLDLKPGTLDEIYKETPLGRSITIQESGHREKVKKLFDITYLVCQEEMSFMKFPRLLELEKRHGVDLGEAYATDKKCQEFTTIIGSLLQETLIESLKNSNFLTILTDGSTDVSNSEKELIYVMYLNKNNGTVESKFYALKSATKCDADSLTTLICEAFTANEINLTKKIVGFCCDGAAVNLGAKRGIAAQLRKEAPWLVAVHCMSHRLELAVKDTFKNEHAIIEMLQALHNIYARSPKKWSELKDLGKSS